MLQKYSYVVLLNILTAVLLLYLTACKGDERKTMNGQKENQRLDSYVTERNYMVDRQIEGRGIKNRKVLNAMREVPRHRFVPESVKANAYDDNPLPIGYGQTISQPYIVAQMTDLLNLSGTERILEIGTGSGYQAAILAKICDSVYTIEIICPLADRADSTMKALGYDNVKVICGDGYRGYAEAAPYDRIIVTAAPDHVPQPLLDQLSMGGFMVIPVGDKLQFLKIYEKTEEGIKEKTDIAVRFVPMTGEAEDN
jgi:protein-L-isoaspartate(D-aspartate) O-methyltransferase